MNRGMIVAVALALAACASSPSVVHTAPGSVTVQYDSSFNNIVDATAVAQKACGQDGSHAELAGDEFKGNDVHLATFKCLK